MAWTAPRTYTAGEIITASILNSAVRDNLRYLKGLDGVPTIESGLTIDNTDGDERLLLPLLSTAEIGTVLNAEGEVAFDEQTHQMKEYDGTAVRALISEADVDDTPVNGATTVPVSSNWAYDFINTLTTQADIPYATAAGTWTRLAKGTANYFLRMNSGATAPEWSSGVTGLTIVPKTSNETVNNSDTLQNDDELSAALAINETWTVEAYIWYTSPSTTPDLKWNFTVPVAASLSQYFMWYYDSADTPSTFLTSVSTAVFGASSTSRLGIIKFIVFNGANAGNLQFQWAQNVATAENTQVLAGSHLKLFKVL